MKAQLLALALSATTVLAQDYTNPADIIFREVERQERLFEIQQRERLERQDYWRRWEQEQWRDDVDSRLDQLEGCDE